jgi:hypothetical protein
LPLIFWGQNGTGLFQVFDHSFFRWAIVDENVNRLTDVFPINVDRCPPINFSMLPASNPRPMSAVLCLVDFHLIIWPSGRPCHSTDAPYQICSQWQQQSAQHYCFLASGRIARMFIPEVTPIQPVNVIVQQAPGIQEWVKILISALVGMLFGIVTTAATDWIKEEKQRRRVFGYLRGELDLNMSLLTACNEILRDMRFKRSEDIGIPTVNKAIREMHTDRFRYWFENERAIVYKFDQDNNLGFVCDLVDRMRAAEAKLEDVMEGPISDYRVWIDAALYSAESSWIGKGYGPSEHFEYYKNCLENQEEYGL